MTMRSNGGPSADLCPSCRKGRVGVIQRTAEYSEGSLHVSFSDELSKCNVCGEEYYTTAQSEAHSRALTSAIREAKGSLTAERIRAIRLRLKMSQEAMEQAMDVGKKTFGRWERGTVPPSRAANGLLWLADRYPQIFLEYARERTPELREVPTEASVIASILTAASPNEPPVVLKSPKPSNLRFFTSRAGENKWMTVAQGLERTQV